MPTPGLTAGRVNGEKKHSVSDAARTASLTHLWRWPGDGFRAKKRSRNSDLGVERSRNSDLGVVQAWQAGALSLEGVSQMVYILPERLLALVRPAFDLVLRRIRSLKRCVQA